MEETKKKKEKSEEVLTTLREQISQKRELAGMYTKEVEKIDVEIEGLNGEVQTLNLEIDKLKASFARLVVQGYKSRHASSKVNFLFSANTFPETIRRFVYLKKLLDFRNKQIEQAKKSYQLNKEYVLSRYNDEEDFRKRKSQYSKKWYQKVKAKKEAEKKAKEEAEVEVHNIAIS